jgi:hypothetical protein
MTKRTEVKTNLLLTPENFCYWLNGFAELTPEPPTTEQWKSIKEHLALVFTKATPKAPGNDGAPSILDEIFKPRPPKPDDSGAPFRDKYWPFIDPEKQTRPWSIQPQIIC